MVAHAPSMLARWLICEGTKVEGGQDWCVFGLVMRFAVIVFDSLRLPGEGTYAVVYRGGSLSPQLQQLVLHLTAVTVVSAREKSTGRRVAIKKIKVGQFKDGLDMSAIREVKYLRELSHANVIEVRKDIYPWPLHRTDRQTQLLDVYSSKTNLNLVLEFLDTDLELIIKDRSLVFLPADIKSWVAMTFRGLEFCHRNFILHRVPQSLW